MAGIGDIVEALDDAPYMITTSGSRWVVYQILTNSDGVDILQVGKVPESNSQFEQNIKTYFKESYSSRRQRVQDNFRAFAVEPQYFKIVGKMQSNRQLAKELLSTGDMWEEEKPKTHRFKLNDRWVEVTERERVNFDDDRDLPF